MDLPFRHAFLGSKLCLCPFLGLLTEVQGRPPLHALRQSDIEPLQLTQGRFLPKFCTVGFLQQQNF